MRPALLLLIGAALAGCATTLLGESPERACAPLAVGEQLRPTYRSAPPATLDAQRRCGDKLATYEIARRTEESARSPDDYRRARRLYLEAAFYRGAARSIYIPDPDGGVGEVDNEPGERKPAVVDAMVRLGMMHLFGRGGAVDRDAARYWLQLADALMSPMAPFHLRDIDAGRPVRDPCENCARAGAKTLEKN